MWVHLQRRALLSLVIWQIDTLYTVSKELKLQVVQNFLRKPENKGVVAKCERPESQLTKVWLKSYQTLACSNWCAVAVLLGEVWRQFFRQEGEAAPVGRGTAALLSLCVLLHRNLFACLHYAQLAVLTMPSLLEMIRSGNVDEKGSVVSLPSEQFEPLADEEVKRRARRAVTRRSRSFSLVFLSSVC
jgi:hypothetical protein